MILTIGNTKGGVGKSTLAVNIAIARAAQGRDVLLVDADEQRSAATFTDIRTDEFGGSGYTAVALDGGALRGQILNLAPKYQDVVVDAGGRNTSSLRAALTVSDALLIPMRPRSVDLWVIDTMTELMNEAHIFNPALSVYLVVNAADPRGTDNAAAADSLASVPGMTVLPVMIGDRKAFSNAFGYGRAVIEQEGRDKDPKAVAELLALVEAIYAPRLAEV